METVTYLEYRSNIRSGDLLAWSATNKFTLSNIFLHIVKLVTNSEYDHVGIAWKVGDRLFVIEATIPFIRIMPISEHEVFYHVPSNVKWTKENESFLLDAVGEPYSLADCVRAICGKVDINDKRWQCAELSNEFYKYSGVDLGDAYTPVKVVNALMKLQKTVIVKITGS